MSVYLKLGYTIFIVSISACCFAQDNLKPVVSKTIKIAANTKYNKGGKFKRFMLGNHFRKDWATPVDFEILDLDTEAGGLTPIKVGGGQQTKSLRLKGADGKEYVLRSVNKDPSKAIAVELRGTFAEDLVQDQISSSNPFAPMIVASLAKSAGIFHNNPRLVYVPASARLAVHSSAFAETLCLFEERPSGDEHNNAHYGNANKIINSEKLFSKIFTDSDHQVDEKAFLKARLFDLLIGDWDRHEDQWQWAAFQKDGKTMYKPIPRDRDQAFSKLDGVIPTMVQKPWALRKVQSFDFRIKDVVGLATSGSQLDRNFTTRLTLPDWIEVSSDIQKLITDGAIDSACAVFPKEIYVLSGKQISAKLKRRRDDLQVYARKYYRFLSKEVNIVGTSDKEIFEVKRLNDDSTSVTVRSTEKNASIIYQRIFLRSETKEIRLYGLGDNDEFDIDGKTNKGITIRIIGGKDKDVIVDNSSVTGMARRTKVYDDAANTFSTGKETKLYISSDTLTNNYVRRAYRYDWFSPIPVFGYNPDDGLYLGTGIVFKKQGFGRTPYCFLQSMGASYAFKTGAYTFHYKGIFKEVIGKWDLGLDAAINAPNYSRNYYGLGNETKQADTTTNYYRAHFNQVKTSISFSRQFAKKQSFETQVGFEIVKMEKKEGRFISSADSKLDSADFERKHYVNVGVKYHFNTTNNFFYPTKGIRFISGAMFTQNLEENNQNFVRLFYEASLFNTIGKFSFANSSGASANLNNNYEFFQANTLGGTTNLRGYRRDRFSGKTNFYLNTELRYKLGKARGYILNGYWGLLAFVDNGRVWLPQENSDKWHHGFGGGIWFLPFNKIAFTATYGVSNEDNILSIKAGFQF